MSDYQRVSDYNAWAERTQQLEKACAEKDAEIVRVKESDAVSASMLRLRFEQWQAAEARATAAEQERDRATEARDKAATDWHAMAAKLTAAERREAELREALMQVRYHPLVPTAAEDMQAIAQAALPSPSTPSPAPSAEGEPTPTKEALIGCANSKHRALENLYLAGPSNLESSWKGDRIRAACHQDRGSRRRRAAVRVAGGPAAPEPRRRGRAQTLRLLPVRHAIHARPDRAAKGPPDKPAVLLARLPQRLPAALARPGPRERAEGGESR